MKKITNWLLGGTPRSKFAWKPFFKDLGASISRDQTSDLGAQLAFWAILALFPFAAFLLTIVGFVPMPGIDQEITSFIYKAMPGDAAKLVDQTIHEVLGQPRGALLALALLGSLWSASGGTSSAIVALNRAYGVHETRSWWKVKLLSMGVTMGAAILIVLSIVGLMVGPQLIGGISERVGLGSTFEFVWRVARWPLVLVSMMALLAGMYYFLPNVRQKFRILSPGSIAAILLWVAASLGFNLYVSNFASYSKTYGSLGAAVVLLMWIFLSSVVTIVGGEINAVLDRVVMGINHEEKVAGPVTRSDRGKKVGEQCGPERKPAEKKNPSTGVAA